MGFSQILLEDNLDNLSEQSQDYLNRVRRAGHRMGELVDDLLNLSRFTREEMQQETVDLSAIAEQVASDLRASDPERQVEFVIAQGILDHGDSRLLRVVLENLLGNAWKYTANQASSTIDFSLKRHDGERQYFVRDDGVGFDMAYADRLFGPFQRLHDPGEFEGTGIGLATVKRIVSRHAGRVWAEGAVNEGATFYFTLG